MLNHSETVFLSARPQLPGWHQGDAMMARLESRSVHQRVNKNTTSTPVAGGAVMRDCGVFVINITVDRYRVAYSS